jgi:hypothetical protein
MLDYRTSLDATCHAGLRRFVRGLLSFFKGRFAPKSLFERDDCHRHNSQLTLTRAENDKIGSNSDGARFLI